MSDLSFNEIEVPSWIRGYHAYKDYWQIKIGEVLDIRHEPQNEQDKNAIAVIKDGEVVGHIPKGLASTKQGTAIVKHFLTKTGCKAEVKVVGNAVNRGGGYGMEVPCIYKFQGQNIYIELLRKLLDMYNNLSVRYETRKRHAEQEENKKSTKAKRR